MKTQVYNLENVLQRNIRTDSARESSFFEAQILNIFLLSTNNGGAFVSSMCITIFPKSSGHVTEISKIH